MSSHHLYTLAKGVHIRPEKFGLLFYDYRGPRLYFVPSQDLIREDFFEGEMTLDALVEDIRARHDWPRDWVRDRVEQVVGSLESKGLIHGQSIC